MCKIKGNKVRNFFISLSIIYFLLNLVSYIKFGYSEVVIENINKKSNYSADSNVYINYIAIDNKKVFNKGLKGNYISNNEYEIKVIQNDKVVVKAPYFFFFIVSFKKTIDSGYVKIKDLKRNRIINLFGKNDNVICYTSITPFICYLIYVFVMVLLFILIYKFIDYFSNNKFFKYLYNSNIIWILLTGISTRIFFLRYFRTFYILSFDTASYYDFVVTVRTPVYPILFSFLKLITFSKSSCYVSMVILQMVIGLFSIVLFWKIIKDIASKKVSIIITLLFANMPYLIYFEHLLLSDSISIFLLLLCIRIIQKYLIEQSRKNIILLTISVVMSIYERPSFIYLIPLILIFLIIYGLWNHRKDVLRHSVYMVVPIIFVIVYCIICYNRFNIFEFTVVPSLYNKGYNVTTNNYYDGTKYNDIEERVNYYKYNYNNNHWDYVYPVFLKYGKSYIDFLNSSEKINRKEYIYNIIDRFVDNFHETLVTCNISYHDNIDFDHNQYFIAENRLYREIVMNYFFFPFTYGFLIVFSLFSLGFDLYKWIVRRRVCWLKIGLSSIIFSTIFISFFNSINDFERLTITVIPCTYLLIAQWISEIRIKVNK